MSDEPVTEDELLEWAERGTQQPWTHPLTCNNALRLIGEVRRLRLELNESDRLREITGRLCDDLVKVMEKNAVATAADLATAQDTIRSLAERCTGQSEALASLAARQQRIRILYRNHKGITAWRTIRPVRIYWGANDWYPFPQALLRAWDEEKKAERDFALTAVQQWQDAEAHHERR